MTNKRPGRPAFTLAGLTFATALGLGLASIWTGDGRWAATAVLATIAAAVTFITGAAQAAAAEKADQQPTHPPIHARTEQPRPPRRGQRTSPTTSPEAIDRLTNNDKDN